MAAEEIVGVVEEALENSPGAEPEVVSDCGSLFTGREFRQLIKRQLLGELKTRRQHPESTGLIERYHRSSREEGVRQKIPSDYYQAYELIGS